VMSSCRDATRSDRKRAAGERRKDLEGDASLDGLDGEEVHADDEARDGHVLARHLPPATNEIPLYSSSPAATGINES